MYFTVYSVLYYKNLAIGGLLDIKKYNKLMKDIESGKYTGNDELLLQFFNDADNAFLKPTHRWNGRKPRIGVLIDDCMGSLLYSKPRKLNGLATYSRHLGQLKKGGSIGVSLFFLIQSFKAQTGGLNKVIRNQATSLILFKTKDKHAVKLSNLFFFKKNFHFFKLLFHNLKLLLKLTLV